MKSYCVLWTRIVYTGVKEVSIIHNRQDQAYM